jgi:hypothetical protein
MTENFVGFLISFPQVISPHIFSPCVCFTFPPGMSTVVSQPFSKPWFLEKKYFSGVNEKNKRLIGYINP